MSHDNLTVSMWILTPTTQFHSSASREAFLLDKVAVKTEFHKIWADLQAIIDRFQKSLDGEVACANALDSERVWLLFSEKNLKRKLHLRSENIYEVEDLNYGLDGAVVKALRPQTVLESLQEQLLSARSCVDNCRQ